MAIELSSNWYGIPTRFNNIANRTIKGASKAMEDAAYRALNRAKLYAPEDKHNLADALEVIRESNGINGRHTFSVELNFSHTGTRTKEGVGAYAMQMHEGFYNLGEESELKDLSIGGNGHGFGQGGKVGRKFLTRAMREQQKTLNVDLRHAIKKGLGQ